MTTAFIFPCCSFLPKNSEKMRKAKKRIKTLNLEEAKRLLTGGL
jgi:hypothetical protein